MYTIKLLVWSYIIVFDQSVIHFRSTIFAVANATLTLTVYDMSRQGIYYNLLILSADVNTIYGVVTHCSG